MTGIPLGKVGEWKVLHYYDYFKDLTEELKWDELRKKNKNEEVKEEIPRQWIGLVKNYLKHNKSLQFL